MLTAEADIECGNTKTTFHARDINKNFDVLYSRKIISFSHLNSTNFKDNFKDNFMREKVHEMASKAKTLSICGLEPNSKLVQGDLMP